MKKPVLISSLIHSVVFGGLAVAIFIKPDANILTHNGDAISGIEFHEGHSNDIKRPMVAKKSAPVTHEVSEKGEEGTENLNLSSTSSQDSAGSSGQSSYFSDLQRRIQNEERYPKEAKKRGIEEVIIVFFQLNDRGEITQIRLDSAAKSQILADAAIDAVKAASPFSAPPAGISRDFRIPIEFKIK